MTVELLGFIAGLLTTLSFGFQVLKILQNPCKRHATQGISLLMYFSFVVGVTLWLTYGIFIGSLSIILWNAVTLTLALIVFCITLRYHGPVCIQKRFSQ